MSEDIQERINTYVAELATLLYEQADKSQLTDLESIEKKVRSQILESVSPGVALFLSNKKQVQK